MRREKEKKVARAGIEPASAAPNQLARPIVGRSVPAAGSKKSA